MYREKELVAVAKRENNNKRSYLVVNRKQGKHIPVSPGEALLMFGALADLLKDAYSEENLLLVGFAETATAIGAHVAAKLDSFYMQTTREEIYGVNFLYFSEEHSHATEQKLVRDDLDAVMGRIDRIVFIEDEVTTGNTILGIVDRIEAAYGRSAAFSVASLLNGMDEEAVERYRKRGIRLHYLVRTDHGAYSELAEKYQGDGIYEEAKTTEDAQIDIRVRDLILHGWMNARRLHRSGDSLRACKKLAKDVIEQVGAKRDMRCLVLGTEEFMYPALVLADELEQKGAKVRFHATTRSPIAVSGEPDYPLHVRYELVSMYETGRRTFIYDLSAYDMVIVVSDAEPTEGGRRSLLHALAEAGNRNIVMVRWQE